MSQVELRRMLSQLVWPNGTIVLIAAIAIASGFFNHLIARGADYATVAVIAAGLLTAWRFHAMRSIAGLVLFAATTFAFAHANAANSINSAAHALFAALCFLLPLNVVALLLVEEFTLSLEPIGYWLGFATVQAGVLAATCRPGEETSFWTWLNWHPSWWPIIPIGPITAFTFIATTVALLYKFAKDRRPLDAGLAWSLLPSVLACFSSASLRTAYLAAGAIAITVSVIETSYQLAYEDELTRLPGRRAFNQTIAALDDEYAIAMVDVDHFKKFNDTYGHEVGDQVLRMVASRLASVTGDGRSFRCGGEEFAVVFPGKNANDVIEHVEQLRRSIEDSTFTVRGPARSQRRRDERRYCHSPRHLQNQKLGTSVTVSIGLAQPRAADDDVKWVVEAADKALYAAKQRGRNRVVVATTRHRQADRAAR
jgi:diguanylate cyclase (GGDEF)-like protein